MKKHGNFKNGKPKCLDCGKELSNYDSIRCNKCSRKNRFGINAPMFGKKHKKETKLKYSKDRQGAGNSFFGKKHTIETRIKLKKQRNTDEYKIEQSIHSKNLWRNSDYRLKVSKKVSLSNMKSPNKTELSLYKLISFISPKKYKFVGDGKIWIDTYNPDFINKKDRKIIELYGNYWHSFEKRGLSKDKEEQRKIKKYKEFGYKTLIVWSDELKNESKLLKKLIKFDKV